MKIQGAMLGTAMLVACGGGGNDPGDLEVDAASAAVDASAPDAIRLAPLGATCSTGEACASGFCVDDVCCESACDGGCATCGGDGTCAPVPAGETCGETYLCEGDLTCPAQCAANTDCSAGASCVDGACIASKWAFSTSTTVTGAIGGLLGADAFCQARADAVGLPGTYMAWLATAAASPASRFTQATVAYVMPTNTGTAVRLADDWADLTDGTIDTPFNRREDGMTVPPNVPWTNVTTNGNTRNLGDCLGWTNANSNVTGVQGFSNTTESVWTENDTGMCNVLHRLFCFQQ